MTMAKNCKKRLPYLFEDKREQNCRFDNVNNQKSIMFVKLGKTLGFKNPFVVCKNPKLLNFPLLSERLDAQERERAIPA